MLGHAVGWPVARGGSGRITDGLVTLLQTLGGEVETGRPVSSLDDLPPARAVLLDVTPRQLLAIAGARLPPGLPPPARALPLRARRVQGRLGARRPDPLALAGVRARGDGARRGHDGRDRRGRGRRRGRRPPRATLRPARPADPRRPEPGARGAAHRMGVLPRARRIAGRHDRAHRAPGGAVRARVPRPRPGAREPRPGPARAREPELRGRRHHRRAPGPGPKTSPGRWPAPIPTPRRRPGSTSAQRRRRPAAASTACAAGTRPGRPCGATWRADLEAGRTGQPPPGGSAANARPSSARPEMPSLR